MDASKPFTFDRVVRIIGVVILLALIFLLLRYLSNVIFPFLVAWLFAYLLHPIVLLFQNKLKLKNRLLSVIITLIVCGGILTGVGFLTVPLISQELAKLYDILSSYSDQIQIETFLPLALQEQINEFFQNINMEMILNNKTIMDMLGKALPGVWQIVDGSFSILFGISVFLIVLLYMFFILLEYERVTNGMLHAIPSKHRDLVSDIFQDLEIAMNRYFRGQALIAISSGILCAIGFSIIGLHLSVIFGILIGVLTLVPYLKIVALVPAVLIGFLQSVETGQSFGSIILGLVIVFLIVQLIEDLVIVPIIMGKVTGLNPAIIILSLAIWGSLLGVIGLIVALPLTTFLISYYKRYILHENSTTSKEIETKI